jgi:hypothetical protein
MYDQALDKVQYVNLSVDIHHVFPQKWCNDHGIDDERRESIVNKTPLAAATNRCIGGAAPASYLQVIEKKSGVSAARLDELLATHVVDPVAMRDTNFDAYFIKRRSALLGLVETAMGKPAQRDLDAGLPDEDISSFDVTDLAQLQDDDELYDFGESVDGDI